MYCDVSMANGTRMEVDTQDAQVAEFYRKGQLKHEEEPGNPAVTSSRIPWGVELVYVHSISKEEAVLLGLMLSRGPPVRCLSIWQISLEAFRVAFEDLKECPSLKEVTINIDCENKKLGRGLSVLFRRLHFLHLRCTNTGSEFATDIASYIRQNTPLRQLVLSEGCGGDRGAAALIEALTVNYTLESFVLDNMNLSSDILICCAKMLRSNLTLKLVDLRDACFVEKNEVQSLLQQDATVFKRLQIAWPEPLLQELTGLVTARACSPVVSVNVTPTVAEGVLREFFEAVAADTVVHGLVFEPCWDALDAVAYGIAYVVKRNRTLRQIWNHVRVKRGNEHQLVSVLDALKENRSISKFAMYVESITPEIATSLSELLAVNNTLNCVSVCDAWEISHKDLETILKGLRTNYTLTDLLVVDDPDEYKRIHEMEALLRRNVLLEKKAAEMVISDGDSSDAEGVDALKKLRHSAGLVEKVRVFTGKTTEAATQAIQSTLARLHV